MTPTSSSPTSFWDWSVATYARPGIKDALLALQNTHGFDINMVLWRLWLDQSHRAPTPEMDRAAHELSQRWRATVVGPLRAARDDIKHPPSGVDMAQALELRERILHVELEAERLQQDALERLASNAPPAKNDCDPRTALRGLTTDGSAPSQTFEEIFSPLIKALAVR